MEEALTTTPPRRQGSIGVRAWFSRQRWLTLHANCSKMAGAWDDLLSYLPKEEIRVVNGIAELWLARDVQIVESGASPKD